MSRIYLDGCILLDCFPAIKIGGSKILLDIQPSFFLKERLIYNHCSLKEFSFWEALLQYLFTLRIWFSLNVIYAYTRTMHSSETVASRRMKS